MIELLKNRRSIRKFKEDKVEEGKIKELIKAALLSPSSKNRNPWEFIIVENKNILNELSKCKEHGANFLSGAPLALVVIADEGKSDVWVEDTSITSIIIQITAESLGLGSCWIQIRNRMKNSEESAEQYVKKLLGIPERYKVESIIALGYKDETKAPHCEDKLQLDKIHKNKF